MRGDENPASHTTRYWVGKQKNWDAEPFYTAIRPWHLHVKMATSTAT
jgi:hypothetical protein